MDASQNYCEILPCYLKADDHAYSQAIEAEKAGELQPGTQNTPAQEHSE